MKRSSSNLCAQPSKKMAIECNICYQALKGENCRVCKKHICKACIKKWKNACTGKDKKPDCPFCRSTWEKPNFFIEAPSDALGTGTLISIWCGSHYHIVPISLNGTLHGIAVLDPNLLDHEILPSERTFASLPHLEKYAADIKDLFDDLESSASVLTTDIPHETFDAKFQMTEVDLDQITLPCGNVVYLSMEVEELIMAAMLQDINPF